MKLRSFDGGGTMQIVDVLRDKMAQDADLLQLDHGGVSGVGCA